jgi:ADP-ribose pyrophosphatase YjhB (NUDIX family)
MVNLSEFESFQPEPESVVHEYTAGGIVVYRTGLTYHVLLILDRYNTWTIPKGFIDPGETDIEGAMRETAEETDMHDLMFLARLTPVTADFSRNGVPTRKHIQYFLLGMYAPTEPVPQHSEGIKDARFFPIEDALHILGYVNTDFRSMVEAYELLFGYPPPDERALG